MLTYLRDVARTVDDGLLGVRHYDVGVLVECVDAAPQEIPTVQVVVRCELEQLAAGLSEHEVVVRRSADVSGLADEADPRVVRRVGVDRSLRCRRWRRYRR
jgi:hypothetical protein